jgi:hypothetical protein
MPNSRLPLPLELTEPVLLAGDVDTLVRNGFGPSTYDPKTQLCAYADGGTSCEQNCESCVELVVVDLTFDGIMIDDLFSL